MNAATPKTTLRRIAATAVMIAAPALIAVGTASVSHADGGVRYNGPSTSQPVQHPAFPNQGNFPKPGSREHHRHQWNHAG
jgi:hypothetical protein